MLVYQRVNHLAAMPLVSGYSVLAVGRDMHTLVSFYTKAAGVKSTCLMSEFRVYIYIYIYIINIIYIYMYIYIYMANVSYQRICNSLCQAFFIFQLGSAYFFG